MIVLDSYVVTGF